MGSEAEDSAPMVNVIDLHCQLDWIVKHSGDQCSAPLVCLG